MPGATGCGVQSRLTRTPRAPPAAHSTCGQSARGAECTNRTPRVVTPDIPTSSTESWCVFPNDHFGEEVGMPGVTTRGVLFVHSAPRALCPHVEWAAGGALGVRVSLHWTPQPVETGMFRAELSLSLIHI